jgi:hypothetical protein
MEWRTLLFHALRHGAVCIINFTTMTTLLAIIYLTVVHITIVEVV